MALFPKEFKDAISRLPSEEKDKLIFRLLRGDMELANRLHFELVSTDSREERRAQVRREIEDNVSRARYYVEHSATPGETLMEARDASGMVNQHVKITRDKYGEAALQLLILVEYLKIAGESFMDSPPKRTHTLYIYLVAKAFKIMVLLRKLHDDFLVDFLEELEEAGRLMSRNPGLMREATRNGLDVKWLLGGDIPEDIAAVEKTLRANGFLKK